jgi:hypothetical protein
MAAMACRPTIRRGDEKRWDGGVGVLEWERVERGGEGGQVEWREVGGACGSLEHFCPALPCTEYKYKYK